MSEHENNKIKVAVENLPGCKVNLKVTILPETSAKAQSEAVKKIRKEISIPGFRKGKVPEKMVLEKYSKEVHSEFLDIVTNDTIQEAIFLSKCFPLNQGKDLKVKIIEEIQTDAGGVIEANFETYPVVPEIKPSDLEIENTPLEEVSDKEIDKHIHFLRVHHAEKEEVKERSAEDGDIVDIEVTNEEDPENPRAVNDVHLHSEYTEPAIYNAVIGLNIDDSKEGVKPEEGEASAVKITLKAIKSATLPEINEEFLKKMGVDTEEKLREEIANHYTRENEKKRRGSLHFAIEDALAKTYEFEVPESMFSAEKDRLIASVDGDASEEDQEKATNNANQSIRLQFILSKIIIDQKIEVSKEEISSKTMEVLMQNREMMMGGDVDFNAIQARVENSLMFEKALDYIMDNANLVDK